MQQRLCSRCSGPAELSVCVLLTKLRSKPRLQKCGAAIHLCSDCIHALNESLGSIAPPAFKESFSDAYTAIARPSASASEAQSGASRAEEPTR